MGRLVNFCAGATIDVLPAKRVPAMLLSVPQYASTPDQIRTSREMLAAAGTEERMLDSGGYQLWLAERNGICPTHDEGRPVTFTDKEANIGPRHVVEAAAAIKPTIVMALDYPIRTLSGASEQEHEFLGKLGFNLTWARETSRLREELCPAVKLFIPVQCYSLAQFDRFRELLGDTRFEGLSMPIRNLPCRGRGLSSQLSPGRGPLRAHPGIHGLRRSGARSLLCAAFLRLGLARCHLLAQKGRILPLPEPARPLG